MEDSFKEKIPGAKTVGESQRLGTVDHEKWVVSFYMRQVHVE